MVKLISYCWMGNGFDVRIWGCVNLLDHKKHNFRSVFEKS